MAPKKQKKINDDTQQEGRHIEREEPIKREESHTITSSACMQFLQKFNNEFSEKKSNLERKLNMHLHGSVIYVVEVIYHSLSLRERFRSFCSMQLFREVNALILKFNSGSFYALKE